MLENRIARVWADAIIFADPKKSWLASLRHVNTEDKISTPTICLACQHCKSKGEGCEINKDIFGKVKQNYVNFCGYNTPLSKICADFKSNELPNK